MPYDFAVSPKGRRALALGLGFAFWAASAHAQPTSPDTLSIAAALARAEATSPALRAAGFEADAREALASQADRLPNPTLGLQAENIGVTGDETLQVTFALAQTFELGGDRAARRAVASADFTLANSDVDLGRLRVIAAVQARFTSAIAAQESARLAAESIELAERVRWVTSEQVEAGDRSPVDLTRAEVAVAAAEAKAARTEAVRRAAFSALAALWNDVPDFRAVEPIVVDLSVPPFEALSDRLAANPALARFAAERARREAVIRVERAQRIPNVTISAGYRQFFDPSAGAFVVGVALPLPVFDRNGGNVAAARARLAAVDAEREAFLVEAQIMLAEAYGELTAAAAESEILRTEALPRAEDVTDRIEEGYREGKFELLDVLDARRTLVALRSDYMDALAAFRSASADVARLLGLTDLSLFSIESPPAPY